MMGVAGCCHRESAFLGVAKRVLIILFVRDGGVEHFQGFKFQGVQNLRADPAPPAVVGVRWDSNAPAFSNLRDHLLCGLATHDGQRGADAQKVAIPGSDLHSGHHKKSLRGFAIASFQPSLQQILVRFAGVVIRNCDPTEAPRTTGFDQFFGRACAIAREKGMNVKIEAVDHHAISF